MHQSDRRRRRTVGLQPAKRPFECRRGVAQLVESLAPLGDFVTLDEAGSVSPCPVDSGQCLRALFQQCRPTGVVEAALNASDDGLAGDLITDQEWIAQCGNGI